MTLLHPREIVKIRPLRRENLFRILNYLHKIQISHITINRIKSSTMKVLMTTMKITCNKIKKVHFLKIK